MSTIQREGRMDENGNGPNIVTIKRGQVVGFDETYCHVAEVVHGEP
jgi:hypothetical protein